MPDEAQLSCPGGCTSPDAGVNDRRALERCGLTVCSAVYAIQRRLRRRQAVHRPPARSAGVAARGGAGAAETGDRGPVHDA